MILVCCLAAMCSFTAVEPLPYQAMGLDSSNLIGLLCAIYLPLIWISAFRKALSIPCDDRQSVTVRLTEWMRKSGWHADVQTEDRLVFRPKTPGRLLGLPDVTVSLPAQGGATMVVPVRLLSGLRKEFPGAKTQSYWDVQWRFVLTSLALWAFLMGFLSVLSFE
jgi:hypothetical protein